MLLGSFRGGWLGWTKRTPSPFADILLLTLNYTSPPSFIKIGPKLPKFLIRGGLGWLNMGWTLYVFLLVVVFQFTVLIRLIDIAFKVLQLNSFRFVISLSSQMEVLTTRVFYYLFIPLPGANV